MHFHQKCIKFDALLMHFQKRIKSASKVRQKCIAFLVLFLKIRTKTALDFVRVFQKSFGTWIKICSQTQSLRLQVGDFFPLLPGSRLPGPKFKVAGWGFFLFFLDHGCQAQSLRLQVFFPLFFLDHACQAQSLRLQVGDFFFFLDHGCQAQSLRLQVFFPLFFLDHGCHAQGLRLQVVFLLFFLDHACQAQSLRLQVVFLFFLDHGCQAQSLRLQVFSLSSSWITPAKPKV